jgi:hypothetical protein
MKILDNQIGISTTFSSPTQSTLWFTITLVIPALGEKNVGWLFCCTSLSPAGKKAH